MKFYCGSSLGLEVDLPPSVQTHQADSSESANLVTVL